MGDCGHLTHPEHWPGDAGALLDAFPTPTRHHEAVTLAATVIAGASLGLSTDTINAALHDLFEVDDT